MAHLLFPQQGPASCKTNVRFHVLSTWRRLQRRKRITARSTSHGTVLAYSVKQMLSSRWRLCVHTQGVSRQRNDPPAKHDWHTENTGRLGWLPAPDHTRAQAHTLSFQALIHTQHTHRRDPTTYQAADTRTKHSAECVPGFSKLLQALKSLLRIHLWPRRRPGLAAQRSRPRKGAGREEYCFYLCFSGIQSLSIEDVACSLKANTDVGLSLPIGRGHAGHLPPFDTDMILPQRVSVSNSCFASSSYHQEPFAL